MPDQDSYLSNLDSVASAGGVESDQPAKASRTFSAALVILGVLGLATLIAGGTYAAVVNNWWPALTGTVYGVAEYKAATSEAQRLGYEAGYAVGFDVGREQGHADGFSEGETAGFLDGEKVGYRDGEDAGFVRGHDAGSQEGYADGASAGYRDGYSTGWSDGCRSLFIGLGTDRVGDWWDYYYSPSYASYYTKSACD